jgi:membrane-bound lytic murein transglycosylase B
MKIDLKTTILFSTGLALVLNLIHFTTSSATKDAFEPSWTYTANATPTPTAKIASTTSDVPPKLALLTAAPRAASSASASTTSVSNSSVSYVATRLSASGLNPNYASLYLAAQEATGTPWQLLAAVHKVESNQSGDTTRSSSAGATGPMQFLPATFNHYATDGNGDGVTDVHNVSDSVYTAGRYLAANGASSGQYGQALYGYNHSWSYVSQVTGIYSRLGL